MKRLAVICTICLIIIAAILLYNQYAEYRRAKEAEAALANMEANKPQRYIAQIPPEGSRGADSADGAVLYPITLQAWLTLPKVCDSFKSPTLFLMIFCSFVIVLTSPLLGMAAKLDVHPA
jgi:hypothetical protein